MKNNSSLIDAVSANLMGLCKCISTLPNTHLPIQDHPTFHLKNLRVMIALSGGSDSVGMLSVCTRIQQQYPQMYLCAGYVNHGIQTMNEQINENNVVISTCKKLDIPLFETDNNMLTDSSNRKKMTELEARIFRYKQFIILAQQAKVSCIISAHHLEDQYETVLMRIFTGTGISGLSGMPNLRCISRNPICYIIRPAISVHTLLNDRKIVTDDIKKWMPYMRNIASKELFDETQTQNLSIHIDQSNLNTKITRNRVRTQLTPIILKNFSEAINNTVSLSQEINQYCVDLLVLPSHALWSTVDYSSERHKNNYILRVSRKIFENLSITKRRQLLYVGLNRFGISQVSAKFLEPLFRLRLSTNAVLYIANIILSVTTHTLEMKKNNFVFNNQKLSTILVENNILKNIKKTIFQNERPIRVEVSLQKYNSKDLVGIRYDILIKNNLYITHISKNDTISINNTIINIQSVLKKHIYNNEWKFIPLLRDDDGVVFVAGDVLGAPTLVRSLNDSNNQNTLLPCQVYISHHALNIVV